MATLELPKNYTKLAERIREEIKNFDKKSDRKKAKAIFNWMRQHFSVSDLFVPILTLEEKSGNCISLSYIYVSVCKKVGLDASIFYVTNYVENAVISDPLRSRHVCSQIMITTRRGKKRKFLVDFSITPQKDGFNIKHRAGFEMTHQEANVFIQLRKIGESDNKESLKKTHALYLKFLQSHPNSALVHGNYAAFLYSKLNHQSESEKHFIKALEINDTIPFMHNDLAVLLMLKNDLSGAEEHYISAINLNEDDVIFHSNYAYFLFYSLKKYEKAEQEFLKAISLNETFVPPYFNYGLMQLRLGNYPEAKKLFEKVLKLDPNDAKAYNNLKKTLNKMAEEE